MTTVPAQDHPDQRGRDGRRLSRRQFLAAAAGGAGAVAAGGALVAGAWPLIAREDLVPGIPPRIRLAPRAWTTDADHVTFAAIGDNGSGGRNAMAVATSMAEVYETAPFGLCSMLGDICYYGSIDERFVDVFLRPLGPLIDAGVTFELAIGNHDGSLFQGERELAEVEARLTALGVPGRFYGTSHGPADFFYLDSSVSAVWGPLAQEQLRWLEDALHQSAARWRVVALHHPPYSSGRHGVTPGLIERLVPILERHEVDLVLSGHDHHYERTRPIGGITYVVSGGGCKTSPVFESDYTAVAASTLQFLHATIDGDRMSVRCISPDGGTIDRFELRARR